MRKLQNQKIEVWVLKECSALVDATPNIHIQAVVVSASSWEFNSKSVAALTPHGRGSFNVGVSHRESVW